MNNLEKLISRLPALFQKEETSNNYKLLSLVAKQSNELQLIFDTIQKFWDVDQAKGYGLDRLGKDEGIKRGRYDDETYRKMIKIQYIVNLSDGDIETMNLILKAYMGNGFKGLEEGWNSDFLEPASFMVWLNNGANHFPIDLLKRIKPAGVGYYLLFEAMKVELEFAVTYKSWEIPYPICNRHWCDKMFGKNVQANFSISSQNIDIKLCYPITNRKEIDKELGKEIKNIAQVRIRGINVQLPIPICGRMKVGV